MGITKNTDAGGRGFFVGQSDPAKNLGQPHEEGQKITRRKTWTAAEIARLAENVLGCVTGLILVGALIAREAVRRGWVRFSVSAGVIPLEKRTDDKGKAA